MGKNKHRRFLENETFSNLLQPDFKDIFRKDHPIKGMWRKEFFKNNRPIVLELGCGRGEYTVALARMFPEKNFIGVDIKGARMWRGAKTATEEKLINVRFLRTRIEFLDSFFAENEVDEIWITFPDPQLKKNRVKKRLTAPPFLALYAPMMTAQASIHLKTDCMHLHEYTLAVVASNNLNIEKACSDIYATSDHDPVLSIKTAYEEKFLSRGSSITYLKFSLGEKREFIAPDFPPDELLTNN